MRQSSLLLLSGGLDSLVAGAMAAEESELKLALTFDYGQRSAVREIAAAARACEHWGVEHEVIDLPWMARITGCCLVDREKDVPSTTERLVDGDEAEARALAVWVPNRNGVFVSIAAAWAEARGLHRIYGGFNAEEAATFPDNGPQFVEAANGLLDWSTRSRPRVVAPFTRGWDKAAIVDAGEARKVPWEAFWSCYHDGERMCGRCESCVRCRRAFRAVGLEARVEGRFED